jgi:hypothetical protein
MLKQDTPVVVTTEFRGVFFGYLAEDKAPASITLKDARNCVFWDASLRGVLGLAATGPGPKCRIGPKVPSVTLWKISGLFTCTGEAAKAWEAGPWS